jgi:hypothetical protein
VPKVNKGRYFKENGEFQLLAGPFVAALEYATGREWEPVFGWKLRHLDVFQVSCSGIHQWVKMFRPWVTEIEPFRKLKGISI